MREKNPLKKVRNIKETDESLQGQKSEKEKKTCCLSLITSDLFK